MNYYRLEVRKRDFPVRSGKGCTIRGFRMQGKWYIMRLHGEILITGEEGP